MPTLKNRRHELYAQGIAKGLPQRDAYRAAGYEGTEESIDRGASRLSSDDQILSRVDELLEISAAAAGITIERVARELARIGFADIRNAVKWGADLVIEDKITKQPTIGNGVALIDSREIDDDTAAAISEISQTNNGIKIKFHDKRAALKDLGEMLGMFKQKIEVTGADGGPIVQQTIGLTEAERAEIAKRLNDDI